MTKILIYGFLVLIFLSCAGKKNSEDESTNSFNSENNGLAKHYEFSLVIDVNDYGFNNNMNFKYLINKDYSYNLENQYVSLPPQKLILINYKYDLAENEKKRIAEDTLFYEITKQELDSIYFKAVPLFTVSHLNEDFRTTQNFDMYDGEYYQVTLKNDIDRTTRKIEFDRMSSTEIGTQYQVLINYIEKIRMK